jgi:hypothetical protein
MIGERHGSVGPSEPIQEEEIMAWNIYRRDTGAVIVREEDEEIKGGFNFIRQATESEVADELARRRTRSASKLDHPLVALTFALACFLFCFSTLGCESDADARAKSYYWHKTHDPYMIFQYAPNGTIFKTFVSDGEPTKVRNGDLVFTELGTGEMLVVSEPNDYFQAPGAKPQPSHGNEIR